MFGVHRLLISLCGAGMMLERLKAFIFKTGLHPKKHQCLSAQTGLHDGFTHLK